MDTTEASAGERTTGQDVNEKADNLVLKTTKPLHRFVSKEPKSLGIVITIFGCAELLMGIQLLNEHVMNSAATYVPLWQGALYVLCGGLSIYTEIQPSKKMVTVCFSMYVISIIGTIISAAQRVSLFAFFSYLLYRNMEHEWAYTRAWQLLWLEIVLLVFSLCVAVILIFLSTIARLALKSNTSQVVVQWNPAQGQTDTPSN
ncbi:uncharacterized protein LOC103390982 [Cynoglossus semilaevis]|uniref:uncharacterized protein LOC103390982 n=1 Tax=Cynoglossus semilaevis TaxID=244447 RepID=UPI000497A540|nr:uncharacterized protein LOC103390982 [Cynoglossus semilaevis]